MAASVITHLLYGFLGIYRDTEDVQRRVDILHGSKFDKLNPKQKEAIVRNPVAGQVYVHHFFFPEYKNNFIQLFSTFAFDIFLSFGMWTTSAPCGREGDSVTLTTSGLCVFCVIRRSQQNRPGNAPPSENWEQPLAWLTLVLSSNQFDQGLLRTKCSDEYITFFHSLIHACDGILEWGKFSLCTRNSSSSV